MTLHMPYNGGMNLLSVQGQGFLYAVILLLVCIIVVHIVKLARLGYRTLGKKLPAEKPKKQAAKRGQEPVYFIVERKKKRPKPEYTEPKRIQFK